MEVASLIISSVGVVLSVASIVITLRLTKRTSELRKDIKKQYDNSLVMTHFLEMKSNYLMSLERIKKTILSNVEQELSLETLDDLYSVILRIQNGSSSLKDTQFNAVDKHINDLKRNLENVELDCQSRNMLTLEYLRNIIIFLESYNHIE